MKVVFCGEGEIIFIASGFCLSVCHAFINLAYNFLSVERISGHYFTVTRFVTVPLTSLVRDLFSLLADFSPVFMFSAPLRNCRKDDDDATSSSLSAYFYTIPTVF